MEANRVEFVDDLTEVAPTNTMKMAAMAVMAIKISATTKNSISMHTQEAPPKKASQGLLTHGLMVSLIL